MILVYIQQLNSAYELIQSAKILAGQLNKSMTVMAFAHTVIEQSDLQQGFKENFPDLCLTIYHPSMYTLETVCNELEASFLFIQLKTTSKAEIKGLLKACRELRIPYLFFKQEFEQLNLKRVLVPVGFLEEELEKAQFASAFGRFCDSEIILLLANDYGSKAKQIGAKMQTLFDKFGFRHQLQMADKDSFKVDAEASYKALTLECGLIIVSASRDYGLDDLIFGPKELHVVYKSQKPVLLINPRGDLYALCD